MASPSVKTFAAGAGPSNDGPKTSPRVKSLAIKAGPANAGPGVSPSVKSISLGAGPNDPGPKVSPRIKNLAIHYVSTPPGAPALTLDATGDQQIQVSWTAIPGALTYNVYYDDDPAEPFDPAVIAAEGPPPVVVAAPTTTLTLTGLPNGVEHFIQVTAVSGGGESALSNQVAGTPLGPIVDAPVVIATGGNATLAITWAPVLNAASYEVYYDDDAVHPPWDPAPAVQGPPPVAVVGTSLVLTGVTNGTLYYVQVRAINSLGPGPYSAEVTATPTEPPVVISPDCGWGDFAWGPDPWDACTFQTPSLNGFMLYWNDDDIDERLGPDLCRRGIRFPFKNEPPGQALCWLVPEFMCVEDLDPAFGGTGDWHRILAVIYDWLFGARNITGFVDDIASFTCIFDIDNAPDSFLDALLLHLGFNLKIPLEPDDKRRVLKLLVGLYKRKGTERGIEEALFILLGIPADILPATGVRITDGFEAGEDVSTTLTTVTPFSNTVRVSNPEKFEVGKTFTIVDGAPPYYEFPDLEILAIVADQIFFDPPGVAGPIEAGSAVWCNRFCDQVAKDGLGPGDCAEIGPDGYDRQDPALYTFFVDIQRTVETVTALNDADQELELTDVTFIVAGSRVRVTGASTTVEVLVLEVDEENKIIRFDPVSLVQSIDPGATAINLYNADEIELIKRVIEFSKTSHTHFQLTRDFAEYPVEVG